MPGLNTALLSWFMLSTLAVLIPGSASEESMAEETSHRRSLFFLGLKGEYGRGTPSLTTDWVLSNRSTPCQFACPGWGDCVGGVGSPMGLIDSEDKMRFVAGLFGLTCDYAYDDDGGIPPYIEFMLDPCSYPDEVEISWCRFPENKDSVSCHESWSGVHNFCCCGPNCPVS